MSAKKSTSDVLEAFLACKFKAHLKEAGQQGIRTDYEALLLSCRDMVRGKAIRTMRERHPEEQIPTSLALTSDALQVGPAFVLDALVEDDLFRLKMDGLKRVPGPSPLGP